MCLGGSTPAMSRMVGARSMFSTGSVLSWPDSKPGPRTKNGTLNSVTHIYSQHRSRSYLCTWYIILLMR